MTARTTMGIIGGAGWLGHAIARSAVAAGFIDAQSLTLSSRSGQRGPQEIPGARWTRDNAELADASDVVVLSVRPAQFADVRIDARGKLVVSVMAGVSAQTLHERTRSDHVVRAMPNAAAAIGKSFTPWFASGEVSPEAKRFVQSLFETCGVAQEMPREADIDYLTGLTGSGPAFPALLADAMISHAVANGLPPEVARRAACSVVAGASQLLSDDASAPADVVRAFIDYEGTTAAALRAMLDGGFARVVHAGLDAAGAKATALAEASPGGG